MEITNVLAQIACIGAIVIWNSSIQLKRMQDILYFQFLANLLYCLEYFLLGATVALFMNLVSAFRCFLFYYYNKKDKKISKFWLFVFILLVIVLGILNYTEPVSLIPIFITLLYTISSWQKESNWSRIAFLIAAFFWIYYNFYVGAFVAIIGNFIEITSGVISILRFKNTSK